MFEGLAEGAGVNFVGASGRGMKEILESEEAQEMLRSVGNPLTLRGRIDDLLRDDILSLYGAVADAADGVDAVLAFPATFPALDVAERTGLPVVQVHHVPMLPTREFPAAVNFAHRPGYTRVGNRLSYSADTAATATVMRKPIDRARREVLGMRKAGVRTTLRQRARMSGAVVGVSPSVLRPPRDWPRNSSMCGYWWPRAIDAPQPGAELSAFTRQGGPVVFLTLGSTVADDPASLTQTIVGAAADAGVRLVLQRGWSGLGEGVEADHVHVIGDVSYPDLFKQVDAVAHHGGAGTVALGLREGLPTLILPAVADQFFWGHRISEAGAGPEPLPLGKLDRAQLAKRLRQLVTDGTHRSTAQRIAEDLEAEDGPANAAAAIENFLVRPASWS